MFTPEAIQEIQHSIGIDQARAAILASSKSQSIVAIPENFKTIDLEHSEPYRRRPRGTFRTKDFNDFATYVKQHKSDGACVFVDAKYMTAEAVLDLGTPDQPGHADNTASIHAKETGAYRALLEKVGGKLTQQTTAEFLEDWLDHIKCFSDTNEIKVAQVVAAVRKLTIEEGRKVEHEVQSLSANKSSLESIKATSSETLPTLIYFECVPYLGFESRIFALRFGVQTGEREPIIKLRIIKQEQHEEELATELAALTRSALSDTDVPVLLGDYSKL